MHDTLHCSDCCTMHLYTNFHLTLSLILNLEALNQNQESRPIRYTITNMEPQTYNEATMNIETRTCISYILLVCAW